MTTYQIIQFHRWNYNVPPKVIKTNLTLDEAAEFCKEENKKFRDWMYCKMEEK